MSELKKITLLLLIFLGFSLHIYVALQGDNSASIVFNIGLLCWSWLPYVICLIFYIVKKHKFLVSFGGALASLVIDCATYYSVFISPQGSTAALALLFMPLWNLIVFMPAGMAIGYFLNLYLVPKNTKP